MIRLNRTLVHYVASVAVAVLLFFMISTPTSTNHGAGTTIASCSFFLPMEGGGTEEQQALAFPENDIETPLPVTETKSEPEKGFAVVVASSIKQVNAEALVARLQSRGIEGAQVFIHKGMVRVAFLGYATCGEAITAAAQLRSRDKEMANAWVFEIK